MSTIFQSPVFFFDTSKSNHVDMLPCHVTLFAARDWKTLKIEIIHRECQVHGSRALLRLQNTP